LLLGSESKGGNIRLKRLSSSSWFDQSDSFAVAVVVVHVCPIVGQRYQGRKSREMEWKKSIALLPPLSVMILSASYIHMLCLSLNRELVAYIKKYGKGKS